MFENLTKLSHYPSCFLVTFLWNSKKSKFTKPSNCVVAWCLKLFILTCKAASCCFNQNVNNCLLIPIPFFCREGFYGAPSPPENIPCKACPCPNTKASGHSFADACYLDKIDNQPVCECYDEYKGDRCNECADNYYGNPEMPNGECVPCNCNENWKEDAKGNWTLPEKYFWIIGIIKDAPND